MIIYITFCTLKLLATMTHKANTDIVIWCFSQNLSVEVFGQTSNYINTDNVYNLNFYPHNLTTSHICLVLNCHRSSLVSEGGRRSLGNIRGNCIYWLYTDRPRPLRSSSLYPEYLLSPPALGYARPGNFMRIWKSNSSGNSVTFSSCHSAAVTRDRRAGDRKQHLWDFPHSCH